MSTRKKKTIISGVTREAADEAFASYAKADAQCAKINAEIELQCAKIREKYQERLTVLTAEREQAFETLQAFAVENKSELFAKRKSLEMAHGTIGFRLGTPKLKTLKGFTWASALTLVKKFMPGYVRTTEEIAKDRLLADRDLGRVPFDCADIPFNEIPMSRAMVECGIMVTQDEAFFVEPKSEETAS